MRTAPAVQCALEADTRWRAGLCFLQAGTAACAAAWATLWVQGPVWAACALAGAAAALAGGLAWAAGRGGLERLAWDGTQWWLHGGAAPSAREAEVRLVVDLGGWLLLRIEPWRTPRRPCWRALSRRRHRAAWHALRCALYARRGDAPSTGMMAP